MPFPERFTKYGLRLYHYFQAVLSRRRTNCIPFFQGGYVIIVIILKLSLSAVTEPVEVVESTR